MMPKIRNYIVGEGGKIRREWLTPTQRDYLKVVLASLNWNTGATDILEGVRMTDDDDGLRKAVREPGKGQRHSTREGRYADQDNQDP